MADKAASTALPNVVEWKLRNSRSGEERVFAQTELTIEGEARLLALVSETAVHLNEDGFPWDKLSDLFDDQTPVDWMVAAELLGIISARLPATVAEACTIFLGVYPTNEDGSRNPHYDADLRFLRGAVKFATFIDIVKVFADQNDYQRLADPIGAILGQAARAGMAANQTPTSDTLNDGETSGAS